MRRLLPLSLLLVAFAIAACDYSIVELPSSPGAGTVTIAVAPSAATVKPGRSVQLRAVVSGSSDTTAIWSIATGPGRVDADGLFVAPDTITTSTSTVVRARAAADTTKS